ncbi:hypothetical protein [Endozoicomonas sp. 8E]|uniref:hypothetical protein n=1 Tax=Endozoicomonas sp. 8E TaxID=3035692 RepID=UPI002938EB75|nr:hypothetical protein [Endozoicomonas sp. 8E]WOG25522.1 hypothetical protein P6910_13110 [Endozoicomonas sp. 8E]
MNKTFPSFSKNLTPSFLLAASISMSTSTYGLPKDTLCEEYGERFNQANSPSSRGGAYGEWIDNKCNITVLPLSELNKKVSLVDARLPIVLKPSPASDSGAPVTRDHQNHNEVDVSFISSGNIEPTSHTVKYYPMYSPSAGNDGYSDGLTPKEPTLMAAPGYEEEVLLELPGNVVIENGFTIDRSQLKPTISGCFHSGLALFGALLTGDVSGVGFSDMGLPACTGFYMGGPDFTAPASKIRQATKKGNSGGSNGKAGAKSKSNGSGQKSGSHGRNGKSSKNGKNSRASGGAGGGEDPFQSAKGLQYMTEPLYKTVIDAIKNLATKRLEKGFDRTSASSRSLIGQIKKGIRSLSDDQRAFIHSTEPYKSISHLL